MGWYGSHTYLNEFITKNMCKRIMEIGVYNGENAVSMIKTAKKRLSPETIEYYGFDFFNYYSIESVKRKLEPLGCKYKLFRGDTTQTIPEAMKLLPKMDLIFIDGGKSYREAQSDWKSSSNLMHEATAIFIHNADFHGVGKMVEEIPRTTFNVTTFHAPTEGRVAVVKLKKHLKNSTSIHF